jgi:hypothetical protein
MSPEAQGMRSLGFFFGVIAHLIVMQGAVPLRLPCRGIKKTGGIRHHFDLR